MGFDWKAVFERVRGELDQHLAAGLEQHLTEDVLRFATIRALVALGVAPHRLQTEYRVPGVGPIDLVVDPPDLSAAIEFKYPRAPNGTNPPMTQHYGALLNDFYRLRAAPGRGDRLIVQLLEPWLRRHLLARTDVAWAFEADGVLYMPAGLTDRLPPSARQKIGSPAWGSQPLAARCVYGGAVELVLVVYRLE